MTVDHGGRCLRGLLTGTKIAGEEFRYIYKTKMLCTNMAQSTSKREDGNVVICYLERLTYFIKDFAIIW